MYISNLTVNNSVTETVKVFDVRNLDRTVQNFVKESPGYGGGEFFPTEPAFWDTTRPYCTRTHARRNGVLSRIQGCGADLIINLRPGNDFETYEESHFTGGLEHLEALPDSVLGAAGTRTYANSVKSGLRAPTIGRGVTADYSLFVESGGHVRGIVARLAAFALEHALAPFANRLRRKNAAACYWSVSKYRNDGNIYTIQNSAGLGPWMSPHSLESFNDPTFAIYVGPAMETDGMALLSRIGDVGGPIYGQRAELLRQFVPAQILMVGEGILDRDLPNVPVDRLWDAIAEAQFILCAYNGVSSNAFAEEIAHLVHNLPLVNRTLMIEHGRGRQPWCANTGAYAAPNLGGVDLRPAITADLGPDFHRCIGTDTDATAAGFISNVYRDQVINIPDDAGGHAPAEVRAVPYGVAEFLRWGMAPGPALNGTNSAVWRLPDPAAVPPPPVLTAAQVPTSGQLTPIYGSLSGREPYVIYVLGNAGETAALPPAGCVALVGLIDDTVLDPLRPAGIVDGDWFIFTNAPVGGGVAPNRLPDRRAYVVATYTPCKDAVEAADYVAPDARLRRFDIDPALRFAFVAGAPPADWLNRARHTARFLRGHGDTAPLIYIDPRETRRVYAAAPALVPMHEVVVWAHAVAHLWDCANRGDSQNTGVARWVRANAAGRRLCNLPAEYHVYLGGVRVRHHLFTGGGLWSLTVQKHVTSVTGVELYPPTLQLLRSPEKLAGTLLRLRASVEIIDMMIRASPIRVGGATQSDLIPMDMDAAIEMTRQNIRISMSPTYYTQVQSGLLACMFQNAHGTIIGKTGGNPVGTMYLREPPSHRDRGLRRHIYWCRPQLMSNLALAEWTGVGAPTFFPDHRTRSELSLITFQGGFRDVPDDFVPGYFVSLREELWYYVLNGFMGRWWHLGAISVMGLSRDYVLPVTDVRLHECSDVTQIGARLLPNFEFEMAIIALERDRAGAVPRRWIFTDEFGSPVTHTNCITWNNIEEDQVDGNVRNPANGSRLNSNLVRVDLRVVVELQRGIILGRRDDYHVLAGCPNLIRASGLEWYATLKGNDDARAMFGPAGSALYRSLTYIAPAPKIGEVEDRGPLTPEEGVPNQQKPGDHAALPKRLERAGPPEGLAEAGVSMDAEAVKNYLGNMDPNDMMRLLMGLPIFQAQMGTGSASNAKGGIPQGVPPVDTVGGGDTATTAGSTLTGSVNPGLGSGGSPPSSGAGPLGPST